MQRRNFIQYTAKGLLAASVLPTIAANEKMERKFKMCLRPGSIGVQANQREMLAFAREYGFEAIEPRAGELASWPP